MIRTFYAFFPHIFRTFSAPHPFSYTRKPFCFDFLINCWSSVVASGCVATVVQSLLSGGVFFVFLKLFKN